MAALRLPHPSLSHPATVPCPPTSIIYTCTLSASPICIPLPPLSCHRPLVRVEPPPPRMPVLLLCFTYTHPAVIAAPAAADRLLGACHALLFNAVFKKCCSVRAMLLRAHAALTMMLRY